MVTVRGRLGEVLDAIIQDLESSEYMGREVDTLIVAASRIHRSMLNGHELALGVKTRKRKNDEEALEDAQDRDATDGAEVSE